MLIFMKHAKKFLDLKGDSERLHALHYADGRVYATDGYVLVWFDGDFGKRGSYDFVTGVEIEEPMPAFDKVIPPADDSAVYVTICALELAKLHKALKALKGILAMFVKGKDALSVQMTYESTGLAIEMLMPQLQVRYEVAGDMSNIAHDEPKRARVNVRQFADIAGYFVQRGTEMRLYAPLRVSRQSPILFTVERTGAVLTQMRDVTIFEA